MMKEEPEAAGKKRLLCEMVESDLPSSFGTQTRSKPRRKKSRTEASLEPIVEELFHKRFPISSEKFALPKPEAMYTEGPWQVDELQHLKEELNNVKNELNDYNLAEWHRHTRYRNKAGEVQWRLRKHVDPEFLTQAWCKFYENACSFPLVPKEAMDEERLLSVHLCEAPGAFVASLNHWLRRNAPGIEWDWLATTLNPYYEGNPLSRMINDDRFMIRSLNHWCFGTDGTGNLMDLENMEDLVERSREKGKVLLVTADGSIDCMDRPGEQESAVARLQFCETVASLHLLGINGSYLLKMFTIFEHESLCLVYLLSCLFKKVFINKPVTSKEGNSEVYLVCLEYKGLDHASPYLEILRRQYEKASVEAMFRKDDVPEEFLKQMVACDEFFKMHQTKVISGNIESYLSGREEDLSVKRIKHMVADRFIRDYGLEKLESADLEVVGKSNLKSGRGDATCSNLDQRMTNSSYNERRVREHLEPKSRLMALSQDLSCIETQDTSSWFKLTGSLGESSIVLGKPFRRVQSSKFCLGKVLKIRNDVLDLIDKIQLERPSQDSKLVEEFIMESEKDPENYKYLYFEPTDDQNNHSTLDKIHKKLNSSKEGDCIVFIGYSLLSQLNVGVLYVLGHTFQSLGFISNARFGCIIILKCNLVVEHVLEYFEKIHKATIEAEASGKAVLSVLPIASLCETDLYPCIIDTNHGSIKHHVNCVNKLVQEKTDTVL